MNIVRLTYPTGLTYDFYMNFKTGGWFSGAHYLSEFEDFIKLDKKCFPSLSFLIIIFTHKRVKKNYMLSI